MKWWECLGCVTVLPFVALFKALLLAVPLSLFATFGCSLASIILLPHDFYHTYKAVLFSGRIGINVRILLFLIMWIPILLWPPLVILCSSVGSFVGFTIFIFLETFWGTDCGCMKTEAPQYASHCVVDFWDYNNRAYSEITDDLQYPHPDGTVFDISIPQIFVGFFVGVVSLIINFVASLIISALKCIPGIFRCWCYLTKGFGEAPGLLEILLFVPYVVAMVLVPVLCFSGIVICPLFWSVYSLNCIGAMCSDGILAGLKKIFINVHQFDLQTPPITLTSCFNLTITPPERERAPTNARQIRRHNVVDSGVTFDRMSITTVWDHFFHMCTVNGREALGLSLCTQEDISSYEPWLIVGLPSLVLIQH